MSTQEAKYRAERKLLDLVKISPNANPPVCKIMDYGKYKFDMSKREKEAKKNQKTSELKEVRLSMTIEQHDVETKAKNARKFLAAGDKVKVSIRMRGRQQTHAILGIGVMNDFYAQCEELANLEKRPAAEGREIIMILVPKGSGTKSAEPQGAQPPRPPAPQGAQPVPVRNGGPQGQGAPAARPPGQQGAPTARPPGQQMPARPPAQQGAQPPRPSAPHNSQSGGNSRPPNTK